MIEIFLNTHSSFADVMPMFAGQLRRHWANHPPLVIATDDAKSVAAFGLGNVKSVVEYDSESGFGAQYLQGLSWVRSDCTLTCQDDFILIGDVDEDAIREATRFQCPTRLIKTRVNQQAVSKDFEERWNLLTGDAMSMQATIWPTQQLLNESAMRRKCKTPWEWETAPIEHFPCREPAKNGPKRGRAHWDSLIFPYISTAINKGKWNSEYRSELEALHVEYGIDANERGWV